MKHLFSLVVTAMASIAAVANQPDSVYLFAYNNEPSQGLTFAYSADGQTWARVGDGASFVKSDYAEWGHGKKMHTPVLTQMADGTWSLMFRVNDREAKYGVTTSPDLIHWMPQDYPSLGSKGEVDRLFGDSQPWRDVVVDGHSRRGTVHRVPYALVESLQVWQQATAMRNRLDSESAADDATRFAGVDSVKAEVDIYGAQRKSISTNLIGIFFEDINYSADGGLYAELVQNRDFEYSAADHGREPNWTATNSWELVGEGASFGIATEEPVHANQQHYAVLTVNQPGAALVNDGFDGITLRKGERYDVSLFARQLQGRGGRLRVELRKGDKVIGTAMLAAPTASWRQVKAVLTATDDAADARIAIVPTKAGKVALDIVSLFPQKTFKGRKNGLRADLAQTLADLKPRFMRFPGGCVVHGDGLGNMYHWKETIGPIEARKPQRNLWGYHQSRGLGYYEFFQMCEDLGCEPLPVLAAAVPCQNSSTGGGGQQGGIPFGPQFDQYVQDVLDLIEWANGDPRKSQWARMRAEAGHPKPFGLKYIGIGNEDLISQTFTERYLMLIKAVKERYPDITVCGTVGPFFEGSDYEQGWRLAKDNDIDMVDEHYYVAPGWYLHHQDFYDHYDRSASKVYLGEWAAHNRRRTSTIETALACAIHICGLERNGDIVEMSSYAPLLAKRGHTQWNPDLIYFDNAGVYPTVDYYVQQMAGNAAGDTYVASAIKLDRAPSGARERVAVSTVTDSRTGRTYLKLVNMMPAQVSTTLRLHDMALPTSPAEVTRLHGKWDDGTARPEAAGSIELKEETPVVLPPYSFTVIAF